MKTQRRHDLQTNTLAQSLARWVEVVRPYSKAGLAVLLAVAVALFAWAWTSTQSAGQAAAGWNEFFDATAGGNPDPRDLLRDISARYSGTMVGQWAQLTLADLQLDAGTNRLLQDRRSARDELREAREQFKTLLLDASQATILERSTYGLARAEEALGELDSAREAYRSCASQWPDGPFAAAAEARANDLEQSGTKGFYDWFAKYEPPPPLSSEPGTPGARPSFLDEPDAGGILDTPPMEPGDAGPSLPSVIEPSGESPPPADESKTETADPEQPDSDDAEAPPAGAEEKSADEPMPEEKPAPESSDDVPN